MTITDKSTSLFSLKNYFTRKKDSPLDKDWLVIVAILTPLPLFFLGSYFFLLTYPKVFLLAYTLAGLPQIIYVFYLLHSKYMENHFNLFVAIFEPVLYALILNFYFGMTVGALVNLIIFQDFAIEQVRTFVTNYLCILVFFYPNNSLLNIVDRNGKVSRYYVTVSYICLTPFLLVLGYLFGFFIQVKT